MRIAIILALLSSPALARPTQVVSIAKLEGPRAGRVIGPANEYGMLVIDTSHSRMVRETRTKIDTVTDESGEQHQREIRYVVHIPVVQNHVTSVSIPTVHFERNGMEITGEINKHLVSGTPVLLSPTKLDSKWRDVLSEKTIVIWPKEQAKQPRSESNALSPLGATEWEVPDNNPAALYHDIQKRQSVITDKQGRIPKGRAFVVE